MKKLNAYILKSFVAPFVATFFLVLFFLIMQFFWLYVDDLIGKGLSFWLIIKLLYYISFSLVPMALPLAILLSSIMTFGNLSENYELAAMKSAGISLYQIMRPLVVLMLIMSVATYYFSNYAVPYANFKSKNLLYNITKQKPSLNLKEGIFNTSIPGYSIRISKKGGENDEFLEDIIIYDHNTGGGNNKAITAKKGEMDLAGGGKYLKLSLYNGWMFEEASGKQNSKQKKRQPFTKTEFSKDVVYIDLSSFNMDNINDENFSNNYAMMNIEQLDVAIDSLKYKFAETTKGYDKKSRIKLKYSQVEIDSAKFNVAKINLAKLSEQSNNNIDSVAYSKTSDNLILSHFSGNNRKTDDIINAGINQARKMSDYLNEIKKTQEYRLENIAKHIMEIHRKYAFSYICIVMFFIGAPLGAIIRKGGLGMPVVVAIIIFILYHVMFMTAEKFGIAGAISPFWARWGPGFILTPFGLILTYKATTDSALFNSELYFAPMYKFLGLIKKKKEKSKKAKEAKEEQTQNNTQQ
ncbi:MAG: LptF/LptG family permease [Flavobacteriales bacterium]|nr:LptF/LptG family permease [Flavobacteriales bacterium]